MDKAQRHSLTERFYGFCSTCQSSNVWTWKQCRTQDERTPWWLFCWHKKAMEEQQCVRYDSSSSGQSLSIVVVQYRVAAERCMREKELEENIAQVGAKIAGGSVDTQEERVF